MPKQDPVAASEDAELCERMLAAGLSKTKSAQLANGAAKTSRKTRSEHGATAASDDDWTMSDLRHRAGQVGIRGRVAMIKKQPVTALRRR